MCGLELIETATKEELGSKRGSEKREKKKSFHFFVFLKLAQIQI
jgi:hypothetical protein